MSEKYSQEQASAHDDRMSANTVKPWKMNEGDSCYMEVVANAGDPGLSENTHFDILSRFIICQIKPTTRVASNKNPGAHLFFLIKRPRQLWIDADGSPAQQGAKNFVQTRRVDYTGNINVGVPGSFSINTIPLLNHDYAVGETIKCTKIKTEKAGHHHVFTSKFTNHIYSAFYGSQPFATENPHKFGGNAPYDKVPGNINPEMLYTNAFWDEYGPPKDLERVQNDMALYKQLKPLYPPNGLRKPPPALPADVRKRLNVIEKELAALRKEIRELPLTPAGYAAQQIALAKIEALEDEAQPAYDQIDPAQQQALRTLPVPSPTVFWFILHAYFWDYAFTSFFAPGFSQKGGTIEKLMKGTHPKQKMLLGAENNPKKNSKEKGAHKGYYSENVSFGHCMFVDANEGGKVRTERGECMPLVIASPSNWPTPSRRELGTIKYTPAYAKVAAAQGLGD